MVSGDGMLILNSMTTLTPTWGTVSVLVSILAAIFAIVGMFMPDRHKKLAVAFIGFAVLCCAVNIGIRCRPECKTAQYQVIFDDSVSANEVYENYDVVQINGKLWTIRDKK